MRYLIIALCTVLLFACSDNDRSRTTGESTQRDLSHTLMPLHATRNENPGIYDSEGRRVLLRGVNYSAIGDYYQDNPDFPSAIPPLPQDALEIAELGFNVVRLLFHWSAVEPTPGVYDAVYMDRIAEQVRLFNSLGIYVVLDMHQDAWGKHIATREAGESCVPPMEPAIGWDGAPEWATITDGLSTCRLQQRELSPAVAQAFTNFFVDRDGIQTAYIKAWQALVARFAGNPGIAGYDLFNEPNPGFPVAATGATLLGEFYGRLITAIRETEANIPGGMQHIVFFEPTVDWSLVGVSTMPPPSFTDDTNIVFAPHLYCESIGPAPLEFCFEAANQVAASLGTSVWVGEWAGWAESPEMIEHRYKYAAMEDANLYGGAVWQWSQGCWEPHTLARPGAQAPPETVHVVRIGCPDDTYLGVVEVNRRVYSRPYPRSAPGLTSLSSDPDANQASISGSDAGVAELWVADYGEGEPRISGDGVQGVLSEPAAGGFRINVTVTDNWTIKVNAP